MLISEVVSMRFNYIISQACIRYIIFFVIGNFSALWAITPFGCFDILKAPTPKWMLQQIETDLQPFTTELSREYLDFIFDKYKEEQSFVRIRVSRGKFVIEKSQTASCNEMAELIIKPLQMMHCWSPLPDCDFIFTCRDVVYGLNCGKNFEVTTFPIFIIAKDKKDSGLILMPDWYALHEFYPDKSRILREQIPWEEKKNVVFFRGADSGVWDRVNWRAFPRPKLVSLSLQYPHLIDAKFTDLLLWEENSCIRDVMKSEGMLTHYEPIEHFPRYRYLIDIDGHTANTPRTALYLYSGSVMFKQMTNKILWYYSELEPYTHYIPVAENLSDIFTQMEWALVHDHECQEIARNAFCIAETTLRPEVVYLYLYRLLEKYSSKQKKYYHCSRHKKTQITCAK